MKTPRYSIGGYEGDQLGPIVEAIVADADRQHGWDALYELVVALYNRMRVQRATGGETPRCHALMASESTGGAIRECGAIIQGDHCFNGHSYTAERHTKPAGGPEGAAIRFNTEWWARRRIVSEVEDDEG